MKSRYAPSLCILSLVALATSSPTARAETGGEARTTVRSLFDRLDFSLATLMKYTLRLSALAVLLVSGCVHTQPHPLTSPEGRAEINTRAIRGHAVLTLASERGRQVQGLHLAPDVTTWTDKKTGDSRSAPTEEVVAVTFRRDGIGALKGLAIGVGIGAAFGLLGSAVDNGTGWVSPTPAQYVGVYSLGGAILGTTIGVIHSDRHVYRLP